MHIETVKTYEKKKILKLFLPFEKNMDSKSFF